MTQLTRRDFLKISFTAGGALLVGSYVDACAPSNATEVIPAVTSTLNPQGSYQPNLYIRIDPNNTVTLFIHRSEMGQGVRTSLAMILAEELDADWSAVRVEQMDATSEVNQITSGSGSVLINYAPLRQAGSVAREILISAAAKHWGVEKEECKAEAGGVIQISTAERLEYGQLVDIAKDMNQHPLPHLKNPKDFKLIGTSVKRIDEPNIVQGKAIYGLDARVPNMKFAVVARPPVIGGTFVEMDSTAAESVAGVRAVIQVPSGVAVIADNTWAAIQGRNALKVTWDEGENATLSSEAIRQKLVDTIDAEIAKEEASPLTLIEAVYETPYLAHATMEPVNCIADVRADRCELWMPTQSPQAIQEYAQEQFGLPVDVHVTLLGGGFGRKLEVDFGLEAAEISKAFGGPVQLVFTRDDDIQHDFYRQVTYHWMRAGWDESGTPALWRHYLAGQGINGVAYHAGKDVLDEDLGTPYMLEGRVSKSFLVDFPVPTGPWRGVVSATNAFANECFIDELAAAIKKDPYEFRIANLADSNPLRAALQLAAEKANWGKPLPAGHGHGIACHKTYDETSVAMVAEVSVQEGTVQVHKVTCAISCGQVVNPDMVVQQMEGSIAFGLTSLLKGEITYKDGRVQQGNFSDYPLLQMSEMPEVEVYIVQDDRPPQGLGEMGVPPIVPAVVNAIYAVTGTRIRHTPIRDGDLS